jgi:prepilin-type N-terminal cleavage/methylation domain-containing protein
MGANRVCHGFSLIEVLIAVILVGLSIVALVAANNSFTMANVSGADLSTGEFLVEQLRELTTMLPVSDPAAKDWDTFGPEADEPGVADYDDVDDFDEVIFSPPIDAGRQVLNEFAVFTQRVTVENVNQGDFDVMVADRGSDFVRVTVIVSRNAQQVSSATWIRARF